MRKQTVNMDDKHRVNLARVLSDKEKKAFDTFRIYRDDGKIVLEPVAHVPEKDHWIYKDPEALASLMQGIKDAEEGRLVKLDIDFSKFLDEDDDV